MGGVKYLLITLEFKKFGFVFVIVSSLLCGEEFSWQQTPCGES